VLDIEYRTIGPPEVNRLSEIDRSEVIDAIYYIREGRLVLEEEHWDLKGWPEGHDEELRLETLALLTRGGTAWGAFDGSQLVGISSLDSHFIGGDGATLNMALLHVSNVYRGRGIGTTLLEMARDRARDLGARRLYISAMPTERAVSFYMNRGSKLAEEVDPVLFKREPEDIHMVLEL
jgi:GNAT superfamily N-acetyltransferase